MEALILGFITVFATFSAYTSKSIYFPCNVKCQRNSRVWRSSVSEDFRRGPVEMIWYLCMWKSDIPMVASCQS